ncbi:Uncharacterized protein dnm_099950 [Desulfonema magnum]|uniref:Uncharacterized protein n=1 Tax=Desulfonema magnum TaxID=45655 RepID=A0A975BYR4_9BACT|nr:Uncharacterized protein dnm_099950 [Desulfonema magnum]
MQAGKKALWGRHTLFMLQICRPYGALPVLTNLLQICRPYRA